MVRKQMPKMLKIISHHRNVKKKKIEKPQLITNWNAFVEKEANKCWQGCS